MLGWFGCSQGEIGYSSHSLNVTEIVTCLVWDVGGIWGGLYDVKQKVQARFVNTLACGIHKIYVMLRD